MLYVLYVFKVKGNLEKRKSQSKSAKRGYFLYT